jgi:hypothetical protein
MLEVVSKPRTTFKDKARVDGKEQLTRQYVSILKKLATPYLGVRWGFESTSKEVSNELGIAFCRTSGRT